MQNAVKFTPKGGSIKVTLCRVDSQIEIRITDSGEGIDKEILPRIFDRFQQGDASTTRYHGGLGLGLAIVKQLVELHGGTVRAKAQPRNRGFLYRSLAGARLVPRRCVGAIQAAPRERRTAGVSGDGLERRARAVGRR